MVNLHLSFFFWHGESSPNDVWSMVNLERTCVLLLYYFLYFKVNLDLEKTNQLGESSPNFVFAVVNLDPIILEMRWIDGESWPNDFDEKVNRGEDLRWVGSRCPLTHALIRPDILLIKNLPWEIRNLKLGNNHLQNDINRSFNLSVGRTPTADGSLPVRKWSKAWLMKCAPLASLL